MKIDNKNISLLLILIFIISYSIVIKADDIWGWGYNKYGQLGDDSNTDRLFPVHIGDSKDWYSIACGESHTMIIKNNGTLWATGNNAEGQLGDGTYTSKNKPVQIGKENNWRSIYCGGWHTLGIKNDGTLWAWGKNNQGQLGTKNNYNINKPKQVGTDNDWQMISCGLYHTIGIKKDGTLWAWGDNYYGQLGNHTNIDINYPMQIATDNHWTYISCGSYHTIAVTIDGTLWAWGYNYDGQLGDGTNLDKNYPVQISSSNDWASITSGGWYSLGLKIDGTLWGWGYNFYGQLSDGSTKSRNTPIQIGSDNDWVHIACGGNLTTCIKKDSSLWTCGNNKWGQLGDGTYKDKYTLSRIGHDIKWRTIACGWGHAISLETINTILTCTVTNGFSGAGSGSQSDPYQITNICELQEIKNNLNAHYLLMNDINASVSKVWNNEKGFEPIGNSNSPFNGSINGQNFSIQNLYINNSSLDNVGFIAVNSGSISNLKIINAKINANNNVGSVCGINENGSIINSNSSGTVSGISYVGGFIGVNKSSLTLRNATIENCQANVLTLGTNYVGGFCGLNSGFAADSYITNCFSYSNVYAENQAGGFVGNNYSFYGNAIINKCYTKSDVFIAGNTTTKSNIGGFCGLNYSSNSNASITESYSDANVSVKDNTINYIGGFVGNNYSSAGIALIKNCYSTGYVKESLSSTNTNYIGGFCGMNGYTSESSNSFSGTIQNCYCLGQIEGDIYLGGFCGANQNSSTISNSYWDINSSNRTISNGGIGKSTTEMQIITSYNDWNFSTIWCLGKIEKYPILRSFGNECISSSSSASITFISPINADTICPGSILEILWNSENLDKINIEYTINPNDINPTYTLIAENISASSGSFSWYIPACVNWNNVRIKIYDYDNKDIYFLSNFFTITNYKKIVVQYPKTEIISNQLNDIYFSDCNNGWAAGQDGIILKTSNSGNNWSICSTNISKNLFGVYFVDNSNGWAAGQDGIIIKTSNSGTNWITQESQTNNTNNDIIFINNNTGWAVSNSGIIQKTTDSGNNWFLQNCTSNKNLYAIQFINENIGWIAGSDGIILKTTNGGNTWFELTSNVSNNLYCISFINENIGWIAGSDGIILKTTNGGNTWKQLSIKINSSIKKIIFKNYSNAWAISENGNVYETNNSGLSWELIYSTSSLFAMAICNDNTGWIAGTAAKIVKIEKCSKSKYIDLLNPVCNEQLYSGNTYKIQWSSCGINNIKIEYSISSINDDKQFKTITANTSASIGYYNWSIPELTSDSVIIRISDIEDINLYDESECPFTIYSCIDWILFSYQNGKLPSNLVYTLAYQPSNTVWAGTNNGLISILDNKCTFYNTNNSIIPNNQITALLVDNPYIWIGSYDGGLIKFSHNSSTIFNIDNSPILSNSIQALAKDKQHNIWIGSDLGLIKYNGTEWIYYRTTNSNLPNNNIQDLAFDNFNNLWIATNNGLVKYNNSVFEIYNTTNSNLPDNLIRKIAVDTDNQIYLACGYNNGLIKFNGINTFINYNTQNSPIPSDLVTHISIDKNGIIWIGTNSGFAKFNKNNWEIFNISNSKLPNNVVTSFAFSDNDIWIGTQGGIVSLQSCKESSNTFSCPDWTYKISTGKNSSIIIPYNIKPKKCSGYIESGDAIGVFYQDEGLLKCAGYSIWEEGKNIAITAWGDNDLTLEKDGFLPYEKFHFKLFDCKNGVEYNCLANFISNSSNLYFDDNISELSSIIAQCSNMNIDLYKNKMNLISTNLIPKNTLIEDIMSPVLSQITIMKNDIGQIYYPEKYVNQINNWDNYDGYQIFMKENTILEINGNDIDPALYQIDLYSKLWYIIPYLSPGELTLQCALQSIYSSIFQVKDEDGNIYFPGYLNEIPKMKPGEGYKIAVKNACNLIYPTNCSSINKIKETNSYNNNYYNLTKYISNNINTGNNSIFIVEANGFDNNTEIAVFSKSGLLVASSIIFNNTALIKVWGDNLATEHEIEAALENEELIIKCWDINNNLEYSTNILSIYDLLHDVYKNNNLIYNQDATLNIILEKSNVSMFDDELAEIPRIYNIPNPAFDFTELVYYLPFQTNIEINIFDIIGNSIYKFSNQNENSGLHSLKINTCNFDTGIYFYTLKTNNYKIHNKMVVLK